MKQIFAVICFGVSLTALISCGGRGGNDEVPKSNPNTGVITPRTQLDATVKIYFENTLSMDGYINGNTGFKDVFRELLVAIENEDEIEFETEFYLINDKLTKTDFGVGSTKISEKLTPKSTAGKGDKGSSNFEEVLDEILKNQSGDAISVIMADFIYSPEGESDVPSALNKLKTYTQEAFLKAGKENENLETRIYRFNSDFDGIYYDIKNRHIKKIQTRPYYYFVIGPANLMSLFSENIASQLKNNKGFDNEALFTPRNVSSIEARVISSATNGRIKTRGGDIEVISYPRSGNLEFTVLLNLSKLPVNEKFLLDSSNYYLSNPEFKIKEIGTVKGKNIEFANSGISKMDPSTLVNLRGKEFTHAIMFSAEGLISENLNIALKKRIPSWVESVNSDNDLKIQTDSLEQTKTFSFGHMVSGVAKAYELQSGNNEFFNITIPVK